MRESFLPSNEILSNIYLQIAAKLTLCLISMADYLTPYHV